MQRCRRGNRAQRIVKRHANGMRFTPTDDLQRFGQPAGDADIEPGVIDQVFLDELLEFPLRRELFAGGNRNVRVRGEFAVHRKILGPQRVFNEIRPVRFHFTAERDGIRRFQPSVHIDNVAAASEATDYLIAQGHRRIGMIYGLESSLLTKDRERGYRAAMQKANLPIEDGWVAEGQLSIDGARAATRKLLEHAQRPTAIFCATDEMAIGCLHEIKAAGLAVPADISIMGFDDIRYAEVTDPPLTTIGQPAEEIGERVMYRLCRRIEEGRSNGNNEPEIVPHKLVVRQSVGKPRAR